MISQVVLAIEGYSTSTEERDAICCFLDFQEMSEEPKNTQKLEIEWRISGHVAQSESANALS